MAPPELPTVRWGIIATGLISSWFVADIVLDRADAKARHVVQAIGSSSAEKGRAFVEKHLPGLSPSVYGDYQQVYADPDVDVVYIGTPHSFHKQNCLDAIAHGKHVLCEKAFTLNVAEAREVLAAAEAKGVFVMEAMWTRFFPLVTTLQDLLHKQKAIGNIHRAFCDFALDQNIPNLGPESRLRNPAFGAGSLLDIGIYSVTWALLGLEPAVDAQAARDKPQVLAAQNMWSGFDIGTSVILSYPDGRHGIATSTSQIGKAEPFCRIEGTGGRVIVDGPAASLPTHFTIVNMSGEEKRFDFERVGRGFYWEADAVAMDIAAGRTQNELMPWSETLRVLELLDDVRRQGGARFPQDKD